MPILEPRPRPNIKRNHKSALSPSTAGLVSFFLPGLGQIWGGERRKGALFIAAHGINMVLISTLILSPWIIKNLDAFGHANEMKLNQQLCQSFMELGFGSPASVIIALLLFSFALFAARDAFDRSARLKREAIYHDYALAMPEATSGSYIFHASLLLACLVLAFFFLIPPAPHSQITDIEFIQNEENTKERLLTQKHAEHNSKPAGKHDPSRPTERAASRPARHSSQNSKPEPKSEPKSETKSAPKSESKPQSKSESPRPVEASKPAESEPKADAPTPSLMPKPQPQPPTRALANTLPKPAAPSPVAAAPKPSFPPITPTISALPARIQNPLLPPPVVGKGSSAAPAPVAINKIAMGMPGPAIPHSPGRAVASSGGPTPIAVPSAQTGSTDSGASSQPVPVHVRGGSPGPGSLKGPAENGPSPKGAKMTLGPAGGGPGDVLTPRLANTGPGTGANNNPEGGPREGNSPGGVEDIDWGPYMADLQKHIKRCWYPPHGRDTKRVKVIFTVSTNGELTKLQLLQSSGLLIVDKAALKAVEDAAPFRHLPPHAPGSVDIEFTFDYNVFAAGGMR